MFSLALWIFDKHLTNSLVFAAKTHSPFDLSHIAQQPSPQIFFARRRKIEVRARNCEKGSGSEGRCVELSVSSDTSRSVKSSTTLCQCFSIAVRMPPVSPHRLKTASTLTKATAS